MGGGGGGGGGANVITCGIFAHLYNLAIDIIKLVLKLIINSKKKKFSV